MVSLLVESSSNPNFGLENSELGQNYAILIDKRNQRLFVVAYQDLISLFHFLREDPGITIYRTQDSNPSQQFLQQLSKTLFQL